MCSNQRADEGRRMGGKRVRKALGRNWGIVMRATVRSSSIAVLMKSVAFPDCGETSPGELNRAWQRDSAHRQGQASGREAESHGAAVGQRGDTSLADAQASPNKGGDA